MRIKKIYQTSPFRKSKILTDTSKAGIGNNIVSLALSLLLLCAANTHAQRASEKPRLPFDRFEHEWNAFCLRSKSDVGPLKSYYKDTISVAEMTENFYVYHNKKSRTSAFAGLDSVFGIRGENVLLTSPLQRSSMKALHDKRGTWGWGKRFFLYQLTDEKGNSYGKLVEKLNHHRDSLAWMKGDFVTLRSPRHYMGLIVSPRVCMQTYDERRLVGRCGNVECPADFFSFAGPTYMMDGDWHHKIRGGATYLSQLLTLYAGLPDKTTEERTFSVLLYMKSGNSWSNREYTLKLLLPTNGDEVTLRAFERMRNFVERLRPNAFNPLYTTDFRIMTGRYYRVTCNKCGWLVEDYLDLNN